MLPVDNTTSFSFQVYFCVRNPAAACSVHPPLPTQILLFGHISALLFFTPHSQLFGESAITDLRKYSPLRTSLSRLLSPCYTPPPPSSVSRRTSNPVVRGLFFSISDQQVDVCIPFLALFFLCSSARLGCGCHKRPSSLPPPP